MNVADTTGGMSQRTRNIVTYVIFFAISLFSIIYGAVTGQWDFVIFGGACLLGTVVAAIAGATAGQGVLYVPGVAWWIIFGILLVGGILVIVL